MWSTNEFEGNIGKQKLKQWVIVASERHNDDELTPKWKKSEKKPLARIDSDEIRIMRICTQEWNQMHSRRLDLKINFINNYLENRLTANPFAYFTNHGNNQQWVHSAYTHKSYTTDNGVVDEVNVLIGSRPFANSICSIFFQFQVQFHDACISHEQLIEWISANIICGSIFFFIFSAFVCIQVTTFDFFSPILLESIFSVPPDILDFPTSTDMVVNENSNITLICEAKGTCSSSYSQDQPNYFELFKCFRRQ